MLTLFAHELPLLQVLALWDFFLSQPPTILVALAASIIIQRVDAIKGCLHDQLSLLSAPPAVDLARCKVLSAASVANSSLSRSPSSKDLAVALAASLPPGVICVQGEVAMQTTRASPSS